MSGVLLNGSTGYLKLPAKVATSFPFTFVAYIASAQANSTNTAVNQQQDSAVGTSAFLQFAGGGGVTKTATYYSNTASRSSSPNLNNTAYQVLVGVFTDVNNCTVYFGSNTGTTATASGLSNLLGSMDALYIGARNNAGIIQLMEGSVTEVHAYAAALSASDVQVLVDKSANPETLTGWIDGWTLTSTSDLTSIGGTRTLSLVGGVSNSSIAAPFTRADTTAPVLSLPVGTATGATTATVGATTDEGNGTLYAVVTASVTQPSVAQIKAGQDAAGAAAAWSGSVAVSSSGAKTLGATGLAASSTYYAHLVHTDSATNNSNRVSSASFTTSAAASTALPAITSRPGAGRAHYGIKR